MRDIQVKYNVSTQSIVYVFNEKIIHLNGLYQML